MQSASIERVSILLPVKNPGPDISAVLAAVYRQRVSCPYEVIIVDSGSSAYELELMRRFPVQLHQIPSEEFRHGGTRNLLGRLATGDVLMYLSQDAEPASDEWMNTLLDELRTANVAGVYARQIPRRGADPLIRFFLERTYGPTPAWRRLPRDTSVSIDDIFFSNVSSAIRREVWQRYPFREDLVMSEDQYWAHDVINAGYEVVYAPSAQVYHSHNYSLGALFRRNWQSGASLRGLIADSPTAIARRGLRYIAGQADYLVHTGRPHWLPYMLLYEATKAIGFSMGMRFGADRIAPSLVESTTMASTGSRVQGVH